MGSRVRKRVNSLIHISPQPTYIFWQLIWCSSAVVKMRATLTLVFTLTVIICLAEPARDIKVERTIYETLKANRTVNILVSFKTQANYTAIVNSFAIQKSARSGQKINPTQDVYNSLKTFADQAQARVLQSIQKIVATNFTQKAVARSKPKTSQYKMWQLWITNQLNFLSKKLTRRCWSVYKHATRF
ncbi:unnamed protein product [Allacma fusca]|uniref:Uncharacterized protein n=1 Tax=Allacma fusca TaxID=39272 RepID=A0A8J2J5X8_9HEXA|nr:unnamed protein product [Allacma fusca]